MKQTRMKKHEEKIRAATNRNKRIITITTLVGLVCPATLGTIQAMADETVPQTEQKKAESVTEPTTEEQSATQTSSQSPATSESTPVQNESAQPKQETPDKSTPEVQATVPTVEDTEAVDSEKDSAETENNGFEKSEASVTKTSYSENFYTSLESPIWGGDTCIYSFTFSNGTTMSFHFTSPDFNSFTWLISDYVDDEYISSEGTATSGQIISLDFNGDHYETSLTVDDIPVKKKCTVTFSTRGNGTISNSPTLQVDEGSSIDISDYTSATAAEGWYFKGWEARGYMGLSNVGVSDDTVITAVFEQGSLNWQDYDNQMAMYESYMELKDIYEHFGYIDEYENLVNLYNGQVDFKTENLNSTIMSQEYLDSISKGVTGTLLNFMDRVFFFQDNILAQIEDYHSSLASIYSDKTSYTAESKQSFDDSYDALKEIIDYTGGGEWGAQERKHFDAYQALKTAEQNLVKVTNPITVDTAKLEKVISDAEKKLKEGGYESIVNLEKAISKGKQVLADKNLTQAQVDEAINAVTGAIDALKKKEKTITSIGFVPVIGMGVEGKLVPWSDFRVNLNYSDNPNDSVIPNANDYTFSTNNSNDVITADGIIFRGIGDRVITVTHKGFSAKNGFIVVKDQGLKETELKEAIKKAEEKLKEGGFESTKDLKEAISKAKDILADDGRTQEQIDNATKQINAAIESLKKKSIGGTGDTGNADNDQNGNSSGTSNQTIINKVTYKTKKTSTYRKSILPKTGESIDTTALLAGLSLAGFSTIALLKRRGKV